MNDFNKVLAQLKKYVYEPCDLSVESIQAEQQNAKYGACIFRIGSKTIRFRVSNRTPTKIGQFVAFWKKDENHKNQPYSYREAPDLLVITSFKNESEFGQFIFPKQVLLHEIFKTPTTKGKMAIRVYPSWDIPISKQAIKTQEWQLPYFVNLSSLDKLTKEKVIKLYTAS